MPNLATMTTEETQEAIRTEAIAQQNDRFRRAMCGKLDHEDDKGLRIPSGRLLYTQGIDALGGVFLFDTLQAISEISVFFEDNDPYGTHDFGAVDVVSQGAAPVKVFWKIDAYDKSYKYGSDDPADQTVTNRVLTLPFSSRTLPFWW